MTAGAALSAMIVLASSVLAYQPQHLARVALVQRPQATLTAATLASAGVGAQVATYPVTQSKGTVILLPQYHWTAGTDYDSPINDNADKVQTEETTVLKAIKSQTGVSLMIVEGENAGAVPQRKLQAIADKQYAIDSLQQTATDFVHNYGSSLSPDQLRSLRQQLGSFTDAQTRVVTLQGAAYVASIGDKNATVMGAETPTTLDKARGILRNYYYLEDRISQLQPPQHQSAAVIQSSAPAPATPQQPASSSLQSVLQNVEHQAELTGDSAMASAAGQLYASASTAAHTAANIEDLGSNTDSQAPSRSDNPYAQETDLTQLQYQLKDVGQQFQKVIVNERNHDAAANVLKDMQDSRHSQAVLQFGAGHTENLIKLLNKEGLSVKVVTTQTVRQLESTQSASDTNPLG